MRYNERCTIITRKSVEGYLGEREEEKKEEVVCAVSSFSETPKPSEKYRFSVIFLNFILKFYHI